MKTLWLVLGMISLAGAFCCPVAALTLLLSGSENDLLMLRLIVGGLGCSLVSNGCRLLWIDL